MVCFCIKRLLLKIWKHGIYSALDMGVIACKMPISTISKLLVSTFEFSVLQVHKMAYSLISGN